MYNKIQEDNYHMAFFFIPEVYFSIHLTLTWSQKNQPTYKNPSFPQSWNGMQSEINILVSGFDYLVA